MPSATRWPELFFEGKNDLMAIGELLKKHGCACHKDSGPVLFKCPEESRDRVAGGAEELLKNFDVAVRESVGRPIGFVLDADVNFKKRWDDVRRRLVKLGGSPPKLMPRSGLILDVVAYRVLVGVWLMPNNRRRGAIEDFLRSLIPDDDPTIGHAELSTDKAKQLGGEFRGVDRKKAVLHTWLAWQKKPGLPYGSAMNARYFQHDRQAAITFVAWFRTLYGLAPDSSALPG